MGAYKVCFDDCFHVLSSNGHNDTFLRCGHLVSRYRCRPCGLGGREIRPQYEREMSEKITRAGSLHEASRRRV
jgi:hypothetical protein